MAAGILSKPGTEYGPCTEACEHTDCAATRQNAEARCTYCGDPIGYETRYYTATGGHPVDGPWDHALCVELENEEGRP